MITDQIS